MQSDLPSHHMQPCTECRRKFPEHRRGCSLALDRGGPPAIDPTAARIQLAAARPEAFKSPRGLGTFAFLGLLYLAVAFAFSIYTGLRYRAAVVALNNDTYTGTYQDVIDLENAYAFSDVLDLIGALVIAITWLFWMRRLRQNTIALGRKPEYRPAWIFWGWLVPILNLFRPFQVIRDLWRKSDPVPGTGSVGDPPRFYLWWWVAYVVTSRLGSAIFRSTQDPENLEELRSVVDRYLALDLMELPELVLAVMVIRALTARQIEAGARLGRSIAEASRTDT